MYNNLRKKAKRKVEAKAAFYVSAIVFSFVTVVLLMLGFYMPSISFWLMLPIPIFVMVLSILAFMAFGIPTADGFSEDWKEEEIEKEMLRLYRRRRQHLEMDDLSDEEILELRELEKLHKKWSDDDDYDYV